jgi:hypothetical protein
VETSLRVYRRYLMFELWQESTERLARVLNDAKNC